MHIFQDEAEAANGLKFSCGIDSGVTLNVTGKISTEVTLWKYHINSDLLIHLQFSLIAN